MSLHSDRKHAQQGQPPPQNLLARAMLLMFVGFFGCSQKTKDVEQAKAKIDKGRRPSDASESPKAVLSLPDFGT